MGPTPTCWGLGGSHQQSCSQSHQLLHSIPALSTGVGAAWLPRTVAVGRWEGSDTIAVPPQTSQDICCVVFAIFNVVWATLFLEEWKRRGAEFAYKWGTLDTPAESIEEPRPQFRVSGGVPRSWEGGGGVPMMSGVTAPRPPSGGEEDQPGDQRRGVLLPALEAAAVPVPGQPARLPRLPLLRLPRHAGLLPAPGGARAVLSHLGGVTAPQPPPPR